MSSFIPCSELSEWHRPGKGRELQFFATNEELTGWLQHELPDKYQPYELVAADLVAQGDLYVRTSFTCPLADFPGGIQPMERWQFWIWSQSLTPELPSQFDSEAFHRVCSFNGLVSVEHGGRKHNGQDISRIAIVDKLANEADGRQYLHTDYLRIYRHLHKLINASLIYDSIITFRDGLEEESSLTRWTEGAVREYEGGKKFVLRPGPKTARASSRKQAKP